VPVCTEMVHLFSSKYRMHKRGNRQVENIMPSASLGIEPMNNNDKLILTCLLSYILQPYIHSYN